MTQLEIKDLYVSVNEKKIINGLSLVVRTGEVHAVMGPNGSGKSTLSFAIMGHPKYKIEQGSILIDGNNVLEMTTDLRAKAGLFLGFQYPFEVAGVNFSTFVRTAYRNVNKTSPGLMDFQKMLD